MSKTAITFGHALENIKNDIKNTRYRVIENANLELLGLYYRLGRIIAENSRYGNHFVENLSLELRTEFPDMRGLSARNLFKMQKFYLGYKDLPPISPVPLAKSTPEKPISPPAVAEFAPEAQQLPVPLAEFAPEAQKLPVPLAESTPEKPNLPAPLAEFATP